MPQERRLPFCGLAQPAPYRLAQKRLAAPHAVDLQESNHSVDGRPETVRLLNRYRLADRVHVGSVREKTVLGASIDMEHQCR